jgi:hypothetical protein
MNMVTRALAVASMIWLGTAASIVAIFPGADMPTIAIEKKYSFPLEGLAEKGIFLNGANFMESDPDGNFYISNTKEGNILCFDSLGNYRRTVGNKGRGPAELYQPGKIMLAKDTIFIHDVGNQRIQFFDKTGQPTKCLKVFKSYRDMVFDEDRKCIYAAPMVRNPGDKLIDVLTLDGEVSHSFGEPLDFKKDLSIYNMVRLIFTDSQELLVAFTFFPIIRKYSPQGDLISEYRIEYARFRAHEKFNIESYQEGLLKGTRKGLKSVIDGFRVVNGRIFLMNTYPFLVLLELSSDMKLQKAFINKNQNEYFSQDLSIKIEGHKETFFILQIRPDNIVDIFGYN